MRTWGFLAVIVVCGCGGRPALLGDGGSDGPADRRAPGVDADHWLLGVWIPTIDGVTVNATLEIKSLSPVDGTMKKLYLGQTHPIVGIEAAYPHAHLFFPDLDRCKMKIDQVPCDIGETRPCKHSLDLTATGDVLSAYWVYCSPFIGPVTFHRQ